MISHIMFAVLFKKRHESSKKYKCWILRKKINQRKSKTTTKMTITIVAASVLVVAMLVLSVLPAAIPSAFAARHGVGGGCGSSGDGDGGCGGYYSGGSIETKGGFGFGAGVGDSGTIGFGTGAGNGDEQCGIGIGGSTRGGGSDFQPHGSCVN
jgi:hypothetical protein